MPTSAAKIKACTEPSKAGTIYVAHVAKCNLIRGLQVCCNTIMLASVIQTYCPPVSTVVFLT